jgi:hypothetical protein
MIKQWIRIGFFGLAIGAGLTLAPSRATADQQCQYIDQYSCYQCCTDYDCECACNAERGPGHEGDCYDMCTSCGTDPCCVPGGGGGGGCTSCCENLATCEMMDQNLFNTCYPTCGP